MTEFDVAIIGGGPAGYTAAERASENKLNTIIFEKKALGGVCLNEGCIPTKTLLYSAKTLDGIKNASKYGVSAENPTFDLSKIISRKNKTVRMLTSGVKARVTAHGATLVEKQAYIKGEENGTFIIEAEGEEYKAKKIILCTGSDTLIPNIKGVESVDYWTSKEALEVKELPQSIAIIGGGVIGMEFASFFNSMGVEVHLIEMMEEIISNMDRETAAMLRAEYSKKGINFHLQTKVVELKEGAVVVEKGEETLEIKAERIMLSIGRKANIENLGLENVGVEFERRAVRVNEKLQTHNKNIYACGDVNGRYMLAHVAIREAEVAVNDILGIDDMMTYNAVPAVVYTNPEIASVGLTEEELQRNGVEYKVVKLPLNYSGRFVAENERGTGLCKILVDNDEKIIGCHIIGNPASEIIMIAGVAIKNGEHIKEFRKNIFPHPTVGEIFHEVLFAL